MKTYRFIKISNNNNPSQDFYIDITIMTSVKLRMSILKSQLKKYRESFEGLYRPAWYYIENCDYSYYELDKKDFLNYNEAKEHSIKLYNSEFEKMNSGKRELNNNKFIMTIE